jgi:hypothetical protein
MPSPLHTDSAASSVHVLGKTGNRLNRRRLHSSSRGAIATIETARSIGCEAGPDWRGALDEQPRRLEVGEGVTSH